MFRREEVEGGGGGVHQHAAVVVVALGLDYEVLAEVVAREYYVLAAEAAVVLDLYLPVDQDEKPGIAEPVVFEVVELENVLLQQRGDPVFYPLLPAERLVQSSFLAQKPGVRLDRTPKCKPQPLFADQPVPVRAVIEEDVALLVVDQLGRLDHLEKTVLAQPLEEPDVP